MLTTASAINGRFRSEDRLQIFSTPFGCERQRQKEMKLVTQLFSNSNAKAIKSGGLKGFTDFEDFYHSCARTLQQLVRHFQQLGYV